MDSHDVRGDRADESNVSPMASGPASWSSGVEATTEAPARRLSGMALLMAPRQYSSGDDDEDVGDESTGAESAEEAPPGRPSPPVKRVQPTLDRFVVKMNEEDARSEEAEPSPAPSRDGSASATPISTPSPKKRKRKQTAQPVTETVRSIDNVEVTVEALLEAATQRGIEVPSPASWQTRSDGRLVDPEQHVYKSLRDALRALAYAQTGQVPREDIYFLAILRRKLAEESLPFIDGPISVVTLGRVVPRDLFFSQKKLFPVGFETIASVRLVNAADTRIRLSCKIVEGNNQKSPIFIVSSPRDPNVAFRSYVPSKAWKKTIAHFEALSPEDLEAFAEDADGESESLASSAGEDGFGLLRRNITRLLEGGHQVLSCSDYQFWEERHPISADAHTKLRSRLLKQVKEGLKRLDMPKESVKRLTCQEYILSEYSKSPEQVQKEELRKERERREAEKQSVREAARKLLEIEMKAQEDAKEAQRKEREDRKNALIEAKMELVRQKEARKEAMRREKEEERRMREEEKEMRKFLKEEEKRRKAEEKEMQMQRKIDELRERRKLREQQKSILENGVVTNSSGGFDSFPKAGATPTKHGWDNSELSVEKQQHALLKFVREERDRRRKLRLWERRRQVDQSIWSCVKADFNYVEGTSEGDSTLSSSTGDSDFGSSFPIDALAKISVLDQIPDELRKDIVFVWDTISTFSDVLRLTVVPSLPPFVEMVVCAYQQQPDKDMPISQVDMKSASTLALASLQAELLKALLADLFPTLQTGTTLEDFLKTRPLNLHTWPEIARQVCLLALDITHPSPDDQVLKALRGSRWNRDDPALQPFRQQLHVRGAKLLAGEVYEEAVVKEELSQSDRKPILSDPTATSSTHYGVVLEAGLASVASFSQKDGYFVVSSLLDQGRQDEESTVVDAGNDYSQIKVGDYLIALNGQPLCGVDGNQTLEDFLCSIPPPHGVLMTSVQPYTKPVLKHIPTTQSASRLKCCAHVLKVLRSKEIAGPFNQPVDAELYPDYYSSGLVTEPMDLGTIQEKIEDEEYENDDDVEAFVDDVNLVWKNCYAYNSLKAEISNMAKKLSAIFDRLMEEWVDTDVVRPLISAEEDHCRKCRTNQVRDRLLLCDRCDASYHTFCLSPPLKKVPTEEWYCPRCVAVSPALQRRPSEEANNNGNNELDEEIEYSQVEKDLLQALDYLSKDDFSELGMKERIVILRVFADLLLNTSAVQDVYRSLEERANELRKECGEALSDLVREWERFAPPQTASGVEITGRFIIDGSEQELTDELLDYLEAKIVAERNGEPIPTLPKIKEEQVEIERLQGEETQSVYCSDVSDDDEEMLYEELGDTFLEAHSADGDVGTPSNVLQCRFCSLEDGVLNGPLKIWKQSPVDRMATEIDCFELPPILIDSVGMSDQGENYVSSPIIVHTLSPTDAASARLAKAADGFQLIFTGQQSEYPEATLYAVNNCLVHSMTSDEIAQVVRVAKQPVRLYSFTSSSHEALNVSVSIINFDRSVGLIFGVEFAVGHGGFIFVRSIQSNGFADLSQQVFPGDVLWMVDDSILFGRSIEEVEAMLASGGQHSSSLVVVRSPSATMKQQALKKVLSTARIHSQRAKLTELLKQVTSVPTKQSQREFYEVTFHHGPLGLALSLEDRVIVKSLNDNSDGTPGQASLSGNIRPGDVIETVNGKEYGALRDLSQFTATLVGLPRPLIIRFSRATTKDVEPSSVTQIFGGRRQLLRRLGLSTSLRFTLKTVATFSELFSTLPLVVTDFGVCRPTVVAMSRPLQGTTLDQDECDVLVGDVIVGINGCSIADLPWEAVRRAIMQIRGPVYLHFTPMNVLPTMFHAHEACVNQANAAWSEAYYLMPKINKARQIENFIRHVTPRTVRLGKCANLYEYYHFHGDRRHLYVKSSSGEWFMIDFSSPGLQKLLMYLEESSNTSLDLANRIRNCSPFGSGVLSQHHALDSYLKSGPFALSTQVDIVTVEESEKFESSLSYFGRRYLIGVFSSRVDADGANRKAEQLVYQDGFHAPRTSPTLATLVQHLPALQIPGVKAEQIVRRSLQRRYEAGVLMGPSGQPKRVPLSQSVVQSLRRGMIGGGNQLGYGGTSSGYSGVARAVGMQMPGITTGIPSDAQKRKLFESLQERQRVEVQKRMRPQSAQYPAPGGGSHGFSTSVSETSKRQMQPLSEYGRSMLMAWTNYAHSPTPQTTQALAFACLTSFEEVKKATTRLLTDPSQPLPDAATFVCLHHAYVAGLICAMATQALTNARRTKGDSTIVKVLADAFATALLCCIEPSPMLRSRSMSGFAGAARQCDQSLRPPDLSDQLHHVANFVLHFVQVTRYLAAGSFDDMTRCRPVVAEDQRSMDMLPASFVQQIRLLENARRTYTSRASSSMGLVTRPASASPGRAAPQVGPSPSGNERLVHVDFGPGPLGIMINHSAQGKIVVTEYSMDRGQIGQAQASGKVSIGDEIYAINGRLVESIGGMEGFKGYVASGQRPIRVTFKKMPDGLQAPSNYGSSGMIRTGPVPSGVGSNPPLHGAYSLPMNGQFPQPLQPVAIAPPVHAHQHVNPQGMNEISGAQPGLRGMYPPQPIPQSAQVPEGFNASFPQPPAPTSFNGVPGFYDGGSNAMGNLPPPINWQQPIQGLKPLTTEAGATRATMATPPPFPRSSASMGFPSPPSLPGMEAPNSSVPMQVGSSYGGAGFVAPNDPSAVDTDANSISYFDANGTTFRSTPDFEIDTTATSVSSVVDGETSTVEGDGNDSVLEMDTEPEDAESAEMNSGSISQATTPANSDIESDANHQRHRSTRVTEQSNRPPSDSTKSSNEMASGGESNVVDVSEDMSLSMARRSARVPRKITTNIADMYNPELNGSRGRNPGGSGGRNEVVEPNHGEVGELATELLEEFSNTIRTSKSGVPTTLELLRAQLLTVEAAIPRDAFRPGRWTREIRAAWGETAYSCDSSSMLLEAILYLESNLESEWLESWFKSSSLPAARHVLSTATVASAAMRLYALDDAITYIRVKRGNSKRKPNNRSGPSSSVNSSPTKPTTIDLTANTLTANHPSELPFMEKLQPGTIELASKIIDRIIIMQREKSSTTIIHRKSIREIAAVTDLNEPEIEQWIRVATTSSLHSQQSSSGAVSGNRQPTPKRKMGSGVSGGAPSTDRPSRKRKVGVGQVPVQRVSLPCFQMREAMSPYHIPSTGAPDPSLKPRLDLILSTLLKNELAGPFAAPVNPRDVPGYSDVIEHPMDLGTIKVRLQRGYYDGRFELVARDTNLVWTNCFHFNRIDSEISKYANRLRSIFNRLFEHWISEQPPGTPVTALPSEEACRQCVQTHASDQMLLCDSCDAAYHLFCLTPPLQEIPEGDWFCPRCPTQQLTL